MGKNNTSYRTPFEMFGIECNEGWKELYQPIIDYIINYNNNHQDSRIYIDQIKEKFGGLRFYWSAEGISKDTETELFKMVQKAETDSYNVCETCGSRNDVGITVNGWYRTICKDCLHKLLNNPNYYKDEDIWRSKSDGKVYVVNKSGDMHEYVE